MMDTPSPGRARQRAVFVHGLGGVRPRVPVAPEALEAAAQRRLPAEAFAYLAGGAGAERTMAANRAAFDRWRIVPRVLRGTAWRDLTTTLFGHALPAPVLLAPIGVLELAHRDADLAVARAAGALGVPFVFSSQASVSMEACASVMGAAPRLFQLYWNTDDAVTESFVRRAEACGCAAIVLTVDTTLLGWRPRDLALGYLPFLHGRGLAQYLSDPVFMAKLGEALAETPAPAPPLTPALVRALAGLRRRVPGGLGRARRAVARFVATYARPSLTWADVERLTTLTRLPVVVKGLLHPDDAREALRCGARGVVVSNHGGRQVDGAVGALDALPAVVEAVAGRAPVLFDSGVRTGADVFKALALGADAVLVGRPYAYGLAVAGEAGVREVLENLIAELDLTMGLCGTATLDAIGPQSVVRCP